jgi:hypothetical protein
MIDASLGVLHHFSHRDDGKTASKVHSGWGLINFAPQDAVGKFQTRDK